MHGFLTVWEVGAPNLSIFQGSTVVAFLKSVYIFYGRYALTTTEKN